MPLPFAGAPTSAIVLALLMAMLLPYRSSALIGLASFTPVVVHGRAFCSTCQSPSLSLSTHTSSLLSHPLTGVYVLRSLGCEKRTLLSLYIGIRTFCRSASVVVSTTTNLFGLGTPATFATLPIGCTALTIT